MLKNLAWSPAPLMNPKNPESSDENRQIQMQSNDYFLNHMKAGEEPWLWVVAASLLAHVLLFAFVLFFPFPSASMSQFNHQEVIEVDLAAIDAQAPAPSAAVSPEPSPSQEEQADDSDYAPEAEPEPQEEQEKPQEKAIPVKKAPEKRFDPSDYVVEKPGPKVKHSMKKKSVRTASVHRSAVDRLKERSRDSRPRSVSDRINSLKSQLKGQSREISDQGEADSRSRGGGTVRDMSQIEIYQAEVAVRLKNNWVFAENLAGETQGLESQLVIKIMADGSIADVWYAKRSGNSYLDESAYKTVEKSDPLPPLPEGYSDYHLMVGFTPSGLRR